MDIVKIGNAIAYLRKRAGYTQRELADRIGVSDKAVSKWERGQGLPEIGYLQKLSILLDTDTDSLLAGDVAHHKNDWRGIIVLDRNLYGIGAGTMIYDKPLINYLLSYFLLVGIRDIYVACTEDDKDYIFSTLKNGEDYGIRIITVVGGIREIAELFRRTQKSKPDEQSYNIMMLHGKTILYGVDQTRFFQKAMIDRNHLIMLTLPKKIQKSAIFVDIDKRVVNNETDHSKARRLRTQYDFSQIPFLFFPESFLFSIAKATSINKYIEEQMEEEKIYIEMLDRGFVEMEISDWNNVLEASTFMKIVQDKCGMNVYCLEEVAWRRGMISLEKLNILGMKKAGTACGEYILGLINRLHERDKEDE